MAEKAVSDFLILELSKVFFSHNVDSFGFTLKCNNFEQRFIRLRFSKKFYGENFAYNMRGFVQTDMMSKKNRRDS